MAEQHRITGPARGEPREAGDVGARVRVPLEAAPTPRWAHAFGTHLSQALVGHPAVGHLSLDRAVQGADIVLDGVEPREAELLGPALASAIEAANHSCEKRDGEPTRKNMDAAEARDIAAVVTRAAEA